MSSRTDSHRRLTALAFLLAALPAACMKDKLTPDDLSLRKGDRGKRLTMEEVAGYDDAPANDAVQPPSKGKRAPKGGVKPSEGALPLSQAEPVDTIQALSAPVTVTPSDTAAAPVLGGCKEMVERFAPPYQRLYALVPAGMYQPDGSGLDKMMGVSAADCDDTTRRRAAVEAVAAGVNQHSGKIGVILPLTGQRAKYANYIVQGIRAALAEANMKMEDTIVLKDSAGQAKTAEARLAELVFHDKVATVIGGLDKAEAEMLAKWSKELMIPVMLLARDREVVQDSPAAFRVYPDEKRLAETLVSAAVKRGLKRISIVRPDNHKSDKIAEYFRQALAKAGGTVAFDLSYAPGNFDSMQAVGRQMFKIDAIERRDEYKQAYMKAKQDAAAENAPFDQRMVVLKPIIDFDAVFLPDDFRTVRHFAKLFKFHMVDKLPMIGNHEWRSQALVEPWDEFLMGSLFADFIGSYAKLPAGLAAETVGSPYFVHPQQVVVTDFNLIGYRAGKAARLTAEQAVGKNRRQLDAVAANLTSDQPNFFGTGHVFDAERQSNWPTYVFSVQKEHIVLEADGNAAGVAGSPDAQGAKL